MLISFRCPSCERKLEIDAHAIGSRTQCPECDEAIIVPKVPPGPGTTVRGFKIETLIGKGGMGEVYLAQQISMERKVAVKILPPRFAMQDEDVSRFMKEVRMAARLEHPNVVRAYEAGEDHGVYFLAMAFVDGETLKDKLDREGPMAETEALKILRKAASALAYAWDEHRMIHRDIKPANIMIDRRGETLLADLGLSKCVEEAGMTMSGTVMGTPNYMSPEQAEGHAKIDFRCDIYALGATLYHMLTAKMPFHGSSIMEVLRKQLTESLPDPRESNPQVSENVVALMERMLAKRPADRHGSWDEVIKEIDGILGGTPSIHEPLADGQSVLVRIETLVSAPPDQSAPPAKPSAAAAKPVPSRGTVISSKPGEDDDQGAIPWQPKIRAEPRKLKPPLIAVGLAAGLLLVGLAVWRITAPQGNEPPAAPGKPTPDTVREDTGSAKPPSVRESPEVVATARKPAPTSVVPQPAAAGPNTTTEALNAAIAAANPDYNGEGKFTVKNGQITEAVLDKTGITDLAPLRGLPLTKLWFIFADVTDLSPLQGMPLVSLRFGRNERLSDLSPLENMLTLEDLSFFNCDVASLEPLHGMRLTYLDCCGLNSLTDITPLRGMPIQQLWLPGGVVDLSPLKGMPLRDLGIQDGTLDGKDLVKQSGEVVDMKPLAGMRLENLTFPRVRTTRGIDIVRSMPSLKSIGFTWGQRRPPAEFWAAYDAGGSR